MTSTTTKPKLPITVNKPTPYTFDLGLLLADDPNPLPLPTTTTDKSASRAELEEILTSTARDGAQALLNQLLSTCPIASTPAGVLLSLPEATTPLPREKPLPTPKPETKWARFARKKGIAPKKKTGNLVYDETSGEWVPKWGYKGINKKGESDWIVEVDPQKERERKEGTERTGDGRRERKERVKRNERKMRKNEREGRRGTA